MTKKRLGLKTLNWLEAMSDSREELEILYDNDEVSVCTGTSRIMSRQVVFYAIKPQVQQGFICSKGAEEICRIMDKAFELKCPVIGFLASPGVSVSEGIESGHAYTKVITKNIQYSGVIPQISVIVNTTMGAPAYTATLTDFVLFNKTRSTLMVTGPNVIQSLLGQQTSLKDLGGSAIHREKTGIADFVDQNIETQILRLRRLIYFLNFKQPKLKRPSVTPVARLPEIPADPKIVFDMLKLVDALVDASEYMSYRHDYGKAIFCLFAYIQGHPVGIVANNSFCNGGAIDYLAAKKFSRFVKICDAYEIPLITLIDVPGFMPGEEQEHNGLLQAGASLCQSIQTRVPRFSVVIRKCYGAAAYLMMQTKAQGGNGVLALETARIAIMGYEAAKNMFSDKFQVFSEAEYFKKYEDPQIALQAKIVDEIVKKNEIREKLISLISTHNFSRKNLNNSREHLIIP